MANANNCSIDGRIIRIEWASARRKFYCPPPVYCSGALHCYIANTVIPEELIISLLTSQPLSQQTVREALAGRGPIASIRPTGPTTLQGESSTAWLVEFLYYADCKEAIRVCFRVNPRPRLFADRCTADARERDLPSRPSSQAPTSSSVPDCRS